MRITTTTTLVSRTTAPRAVRSPTSTKRAAGTDAGGNRRDIQVLRAVAVAAVIVFHVWPGVAPGGYVGVDVFFVVSGFLITSHLLRSPPTSLRGLAAFWARRVRRLLPAAGTVLAVTTVASVVLLPSNLLRQAARELLASAVWSENWALAHQATDYLAAEATPSPVQHYWSLGVEEQFYLVYPLLIAAAALLARRTGRLRLAAAVGIGLATIASLAYSVGLTQADPARAYFVTTTRAWELGLGALAAFVVVRVDRWQGVRAIAGWVGLTLIAWAVLTFNAATPFPGAAALLPTVGSVLVVLSMTDDVPGGLGRLLGRRSIVALGDISYGVYLWHWPLLVLAPFAVGEALGGFARGLVVVATLVLAAATKRWIEDPVRHSPRLRRSLVRSFALGAATVLVCTAVAVGAGSVSASRAVAEQAVLAQARAGDIPCFGAQAVRDPSCGDPAGAQLRVGPGAAASDRSDLYADGCWNNSPFTGRRTCTYGSASTASFASTGSPTEPTARRLVLLGNSHAGQWQPALADQVERNGWSLTTYLTSECYPVDLPIDLTVPAATPGCAAWTRWAVASALASDPDLVVLSARTYRPLLEVPTGEQRATQRAAYARLLDRFTEAGVPVLVLRDTPNAGEPAPDCVARERSGWRNCTQPVATAIESDPLAEAAAADRSGLVSALDLNDLICWDGQCHDVVGGAIVYFDHGHLTRTFAETLRPEVEAAVSARLRG